MFVKKNHFIPRYIAMILRKLLRELPEEGYENSLIELANKICGDNNGDTHLP